MESVGTVFNLSADFKLTKSAFLGNSDLSTRFFAFFTSYFVA